GGRGRGAGVGGGPGRAAGMGTARSGARGRSEENGGGGGAGAGAVVADAAGGVVGWEGRAGASVGIWWGGIASSHERPRSRAPPGQSPLSLPHPSRRRVSLMLMSIPGASPSGRR